MCKYFADFLAFLGDLSDFEFIFDPPVDRKHRIAQIADKPSLAHYRVSAFLE